MFNSTVHDKMVYSGSLLSTIHSSSDNSPLRSTIHPSPWSTLEHGRLQSLVHSSPLQYKVQSTIHSRPHSTAVHSSQRSMVHSGTLSTLVHSILHSTIQSMVHYISQSTVVHSSILPQSTLVHWSGPRSTTIDFSPLWSSLVLSCSRSNPRCIPAYGQLRFMNHIPEFSSVHGPLPHMVHFNIRSTAVHVKLCPGVWR